jgi:UDP-N-acetylmuramate: L-alanyl-gamma-D-glutamyl-meso-diaminopimelate ligase
MGNWARSNAIMHIHILGICGTFMGGIAAIARSAGHRVTGCDANVYPPMSTQLQALGIDLIEGFDAGQLALKPDLFVVGNVVSRGNPLMEAILDDGAAYISGPQWVGERILHRQHVLAVAGTHGKTTTTSMLAWILESAGLAPGFLIGGVPENFGVSARASGTPAGGVAPLFVIEADEYDTAFFDKRSKFVHYRARTAILNNLEYDHADIFPDIGAIETQFHHLVRTVPRSGRLIVNGAEASLERVMGRGCWSELERFGTSPTGWQAGAADADGSFDVSFCEAPQGRVRWDLMGQHNRMNALAAIAAARHVGVKPPEAIAALASFRNVKRRMEVRGTVAGVTVYDDFAHHPTAIETTIAGLRARVGPQGRILAVLEPRSNTMKLGTMKAALPGSLAGADLVFGYGANHGKDALGWNLGEALQPLGAKASAHDALEPLVQAILGAAHPGDQILVMSNGGFGGVHAKILDGLRRR